MPGGRAERMPGGRAGGRAEPMRGVFQMGIGQTRDYVTLLSLSPPPIGSIKIGIHNNFNHN